MKRFTIALSIVAVMALSACAGGVNKCGDRTAGCTADSAFYKSTHK